MISRARMYDQMAEMHANVSFHHRRQFDTTTVRHLNNFVKACMIDTACAAIKLESRDAGLRIADIACGRGQDQSKWMYGTRACGKHIANYYGIDLSQADVSSAISMSEKYITPHGGVASIECADMGTTPWRIPSESVHALSCQLALHYLFDQEAHVRHFFSECHRVLAPNSCLLLSFADGRSIVRRARDSAGNHDAKYYSLRVPSTSYASKLKSCFGNQYVFTMPGSVENVPEYLCHEGMLCKIATEYGFIPGKSFYFDELALQLNATRHFYDIAMKMGGNGIKDADALDTANLYRFIVLANSREALSAFHACFNARLL